jgi:glycosyltransferase involved in cell wall biosynthesis
MLFTVVTPNRNRIDHLNAVLPSWQRNSAVAEIVVVDYGSDPAISLASFQSDAKIKIVRVNEDGPWRIGRAINAGVDFASSAFICKLDSDVRITDDDFLAGLCPSKTFFRGDYRSSISNGQVVFAKDDWRSVGGYNEWLSGYGFDDSDYYNRLKAAGIQESFIGSGLAELTHGDDLRLSGEVTFGGKYFTKQFSSRRDKVHFYTSRNTYLAYLKRWSPSCRQQYRIVGAGDGGRRIEIVFPPLPSEYERLRDFADYIALTRYHASQDIVAVLNRMIGDLLRESGGL